MGYSIDIFVKKDSGEVILLNAEENEFGFGDSVGDFQKFSAITFREKGLQACLDCLSRSYDDLLGRPCEFDRLSREEQLTFEGGHYCIYAWLDNESGDLLVQATRIDNKGGREGNPEDRFRLPLPCSNEQFLGVFDKALSRCG